jgi:hypothetical protein
MGVDKGSIWRQEDRKWQARPVISKSLRNSEGIARAHEYRIVNPISLNEIPNPLSVINRNTNKRHIDIDKLLMKRYKERYLFETRRTPGSPKIHNAVTSIPV